MFAKVDFVDFIGRKEFLCQHDLTSCLESIVFQECVSDFCDGLVSVQAAANRIFEHLNGTIARDNAFFSPPGYFHVYLPRIVKWIGYRTDLPAEDPRYVSILRTSPPHRWRDKERPVDLTYKKYIEAIPLHQRREMRCHLETDDIATYLAHWRQAFSSEFGLILSCRKTVAELVSAGHHGVDFCSDIVESAANLYEGLLPLLDKRCKYKLFGELSGFLAQALVELDFDPLGEYPGFFNPGLWPKA